MEEFDSFPVFKGLQKPLEIFGIRGRFIIHAAVVIGLAFIGYSLFSVSLGKSAGLISLIVIGGCGYLFIILQQKKGLHNKTRNRDIYIYHNIYRH